MHININLAERSPAGSPRGRVGPRTRKYQNPLKINQRIK